MDYENAVQDKILIMYIIDNLANTASNLNMVDIILESIDIDYFSLQQLLLELSEQKYVASWNEDNRRYYKLTTEGQSALSSLKNLVQPFIFKRIDSKIKAKKKRVKKQPIIFADYIPEDEDHYLAQCKITENDNTLINISINAGSREQAIKFCNVWHNNAPKLYDEIIKLFAKKEK